MSTLMPQDTRVHETEEQGFFESSLTGLRANALHILRLDRLRLSVWALSMVAFTLYFIYALSNVFDQDALAGRAEIMQTPAGIIMGGPGYGVGDYTATVAVANEGTLWMIVALSIMSILHVIRHTRAEEENGRAELVRASAVGRHAAPMAAMLTLTVHLAVIAVLSTFALVAGGTDVEALDAFAMMGGSALIALVFGAVALAIAQVTAHSRTATGMTIAVFGVAFAVRAAGDMQQQGGSLLSWFSPIAWAQQSRPFVDLRLWPLLLAVIALIAIGALALFLATQRDFGAGMVADKPGPANAADMLREPFAMAWVQQRSVLLWTTLGLGLTWFATGTLMSTMDEMIADLVESNAAFGELLGTDPSIFAAEFLNLIMLFVALACAGYAVMMGQRPRSEEESGRLELVLAAPVSRLRWLSAQFTIGAVGAIALLIVSTYALWAGAAIVEMTDPGFGQYTAAILAYIPAVLIFLTFTLTLFAWSPKLLSVSWVLVVFGLIAGMFGPMFNMPEWMLNISPLHSASTAFTDGVDAVMATVLGILSLIFAISALAGFRLRDLTTA